MYLSAIKYCDIANGPGVRTSVFVSGCTHRCPGCFNSEAWPFDHGEPYTRETEEKILESLKPGFTAGLSLLGGEPFEPENQGTVLTLVRKVRELFPGKTVWCYSGYTWEELTGKVVSRSEGKYRQELLESLDVLVDGEFIEARKDISLRFRGSDNQRLLDVPASLKEGHPVLWRDDPHFETHRWEG